MKAQLSVFKLIKLCFIVLIIFQLTACGANDFDNIKQNNLKVNEYNKTIELYNKTVLSFTDFVKFTNKQLEKGNEDCATQISMEYAEKSQKILKNMNDLETIQFNYDEIEVSMDDIQPMLSNMYDYLDLIKNIEQVDSKQIEDFHIETNNLYEKILEQSFSITKTFDEIYQNIL